MKLQTITQARVTEENSDIEALLKTSGFPPRECTRIYEISMQDPHSALAEILRYSSRQNERISSLRREGATTRTALRIRNEVASRLEDQLNKTEEQKNKLEIEKQEIMKSAAEDKLTGLQTKNGWKIQVYRELSRAAREGLPVSVTVFDLDHFKNFNDTYGHHAGDVVLAQAAQGITKTFRTEDLKIRYGGEEFLIVATGISPAQTTIKAKHVMELLRKPIEYVTDKKRILLPPRTISAGIVTYSPERGKIFHDMPERLFKAADSLLYNAKKGSAEIPGRNQVHAGAYLLPEGLAPQRIILLGTPVRPERKSVEFAYFSGGGSLKPPAAADKTIYRI